MHPNSERDSQTSLPKPNHWKRLITNVSLRPETWIALGILVLTLAAYLQVIGFQFVSFDDPLYITKNPVIQEGLTGKSLRYAFTTADDGSYLPLVWLSHAACVSLFGAWAGGHHLVNLLLHVANSVILFYFLNRMTKALWPSAGVALLFAIHPLHVESVAWVAARKDVLSTLFWILTSWAYLGYVERPTLRRYAVVFLLFSLSLLSKSMLVTLPLTLLLFDFWPLGRIQWSGVPAKARAKNLGHLLAEKLPLLALSAVAALATIIFSRNAGAMSSLTQLPLPHRLGNALLTTVTYLKQTVWPVDLSVFYHLAWSGFPIWRVAGASTLVLGLTGFCLLNLKRRPYLAVGWCWYLITLLPVVGLIQVGGQAHADRYTYVPLIGIFLILAWAAEEFVTHCRISRQTILLGAASLLGVLLTLTVAQAAVWRNDLSLFQHALSCDPANPTALQAIGDEYMDQQRFPEALTAYTKALKATPREYDSHLKVGHALELMGHTETALEHYQNAKRLKPDFLSIDQLIGQTLTRLGRFDQAEPFVQRVLQGSSLGRSRLDSVIPHASHLDWANILISRKRLPEALRVLESVVQEEPRSLRARMALGLALRQMGRAEEALRQFEWAAELEPRNAAALYLRGIMLTQLKRFPEARKVFEHLQAAEPQSPLLQKGLLDLDKALATNIPLAQGGATP